MKYISKSDIIFHNIQSNKNNKLMYQVYINFIFEQVVKSRIMTGINFVIEKNGNSCYGLGKKNPVRT